MASLEGFDEIRLLIAPGRSLLSLCFSQPYFVSHFHFFFLRLFFFFKGLYCGIADKSELGNGLGRLLSLRHPKSGKCI